MWRAAWKKKRLLTSVELLDISEQMILKIVSVFGVFAVKQTHKPVQTTFIISLFSRAAFITNVACQLWFIAEVQALVF